MSVRVLAKSEIGQIMPLLRQVHALHVEHLPTQYRAIEDSDAVLAWLQNWLSAPALTTLVCGPAGAPTGYLIYEVERRGASVLKPAMHIATLEHICVAEAHRRTGLGRALIGAMRDRLRAQGVDHVAVTYGTFNEASAALMAREGFVSSHTRAVALL